MCVDVAEQIIALQLCFFQDGRERSKANLEIIALLVLLYTIVVGELNYKMAVLWPIAHHRLAPLPIVRPEGRRQVNTLSILINLSVCPSVHYFIN